MTSNYHTPIATGAPADASVFNAPLGQLDAVLGALLPTRYVHFHAYSTPTVGGAMGVAVSTSQPYNHYALQASASAADGDTFTFSCVLKSGTYTMDVRGARSNSRGIIDWYLDDVLFSAGQDWYSATFDLNITQSIGSIAIATDGYHVFKGVVNGKNASSSSYIISLTDISLKQAAD